MALLVKILCQNHSVMRYQNREYVCNARDHSTWQCVPTFRQTDGVVKRFADAVSLPKGGR